MQYLLKITAAGTNLWRLIAVDGEADRVHVANLMAQAFPYNEGKRAFKIGDKLILCGKEGEVLNLEELASFDSLNINEEDVFTFIPDLDKPLEHNVIVMKKIDHLFCLMPSCLVGAGALPQGELSCEIINAYLDEDDTPSLDLREVTKRLRAIGAKRPDSQKVLETLAQNNLAFKLK